MSSDSSLNIVPTGRASNYTVEPPSICGRTLVLGWLGNCKVDYILTDVNHYITSKMLLQVVLQP